jgi:nicotinamide riboside transporter PnuC
MVSFPTWTSVTLPTVLDGSKQRPHSFTMSVEDILSVLRLDYLSCVLTIASTILVGRRCWEGWALAAVNSVLICVIGAQTAQLGFIPANVFCVVVSTINLRAWRKNQTD